MISSRCMFIRGRKVQRKQRDVCTYRKYVLLPDCFNFTESKGGEVSPSSHVGNVSVRIANCINYTRRFYSSIGEPCDSF